MKKLITLFSIAFLSVSGLFAQNTDAPYVANWQLPIDFWFAGAPAPAEGIEAYPRTQATAQFVSTFDAAGADFDAAWASIAGNGNVVGSTAAHILGLAASNKGADDFKDAAYKVVYDQSNMYILVQWTDDDVTGTESVELCLSPYFKLDAEDRTDFPTAWYTRWSQFGANKLLFDKNGFKEAMMVNFDVDGKGTINWGGTTPTLTDNLYLDNKTVVGSKTVKWIITVGYQVLTGEYRPEFNADIWKALNSGKGISFDLKVNDVDTDDALNADNPPVAKPAEYWWSSTSNDCWQSTMYAGFLNPADAPATGDDAYVANWQLPIEFWFAGAPAPAEGIDAYPRKEIKAVGVTAFDALAADFDQTWNSISVPGNIIGATPANILGLPASNTGANDLKDAAFKVLYDESNMYIMLQFTDDDVTGEEYIEVCLSPYFKLDATDRTDFPTAWYTRWSQFGANKLGFGISGFDAAMMVNFDEAGKGTINWGGTTPILTENLFVDNKTAIGSKTVKMIITIGYPVLTGEYRPEFNTAIWKALNSGKGISFDLKINDKDTDDALNTDNPPVAKPAEYWWNTTSNDCWQSTMYAGFLGVSDTYVSLVKPVKKTNIFSNVTHDRIELSKTANVEIFNIIGLQVMSKRGVSQIDLSGLKTGAYIIRANGESMKFVR